MMNLRLYLNIILSILLLGIMVSCQNDDALCEGAKQSNVKLTLTLGEHASRTVINGTYDNENVMNTVHLFFYPSGAGKTDDATFECLNITLPKPEGQTHDIEFEIPVDKFKDLFPNDNNTCQVYAIVNLPSVSDDNPDKLVDHELPANHSLASLKDKVILYAGDEFSNFVMDGLAEITLNDDSKLVGEIQVKRVAAKISLTLNIHDEVIIYEKNDEPDLADKGKVIERWSPVGVAKISFRRGSKRTKLGSTPDDYLYTPNDGDLINTVFYESDGDNGNTFYTYPTNWKDNEKFRTHFILDVEWEQKLDKSSNKGERKHTYYEVTANASGSYVERNHHYIINQEVSVLGSPHIEDPYELKLTNGFTILDWGGIATEGIQSETTSEADVNQLKYLVVDETSIEMNNTSSKIINFASSDPIELSSVLVKWDYIKTENSKVLVFPTTMSNPPVNTSGDISYEITKSTGNPYTEDTNQEVNVTNRIQGDYKVIITIHNANPQVEGDRNYIEIIHHLNNSMSPDADYTKYSIDFTVQHQDNDAYNETIKILQYPMLSIENDINYDYIYNDPDKQDDNSKGHTNENKGYVYVNGNNENRVAWDGVAGIAYTTNPNRYIISISALNENGNEYIIGDPRVSKNISELTKLNNYYGTNNYSTSAQVISPQFMFASSYGGCPDAGLDLAAAEKRCAAYQEDGYYAGRWRLPTKAEILYATQLSVWEVIPPLFSDGMNYWSAQGCVTIDGNTVKDNATTPSGQRVVRCVYDTWYWGKGHVAGSAFQYKTSL